VPPLTPAPRRIHARPAAGYLLLSWSRRRARILLATAPPGFHHPIAPGGVDDRSRYGKATDKKKIARGFWSRTTPSGNLTLGHIVDKDLTSPCYWPGQPPGPVRLAPARYWEEGQENCSCGAARPPPTPVLDSVWPQTNVSPRGDLADPPRPGLGPRRRTPKNVISFNEVNQGAVHCGRLGRNRGPFSLFPSEEFARTALPAPRCR